MSIEDLPSNPVFWTTLIICCYFHNDTRRFVNFSLLLKLKRIYIYAYIDYNYQQQQEKKTNRECGYRDCLDNIVVVVIVKKCRRGGEEEKKEIIYYGNKNRIDILAHIQISFYYQHG